MSKISVTKNADGSWSITARYTDRTVARKMLSALKKQGFDSSLDSSGLNLTIRLHFPGSPKAEIPSGLTAEEQQAIKAMAESAFDPKSIETQYGIWDPRKILDEHKFGDFF